MQVSRLNVDAQSALLTVEIENSDYADKVKSALDKYKKTANLPGFRPGHVPSGLIQKKYGKAILAEEINKLANDGVYNFIRENKIDILGNPIPKEGTDFVGDFESPNQFTFVFEIGLSPSFDYKKVINDKIEYPKVKVDDTLIDQQLDDLRRRYGKLMSANSVEKSDMVLGTFSELNEDGTLKEDGISHSATLSLEFIENKNAAELLLGKEVGNSITLDPSMVSKNTEDMATMLGIDLEIAKTLHSNFEFKITDIKRMEKADLNEELFAKLFPDGEVNDEKSIRERIKIDLESMFEKDSDRLLTRNAYNQLMEKVDVRFPEDFLKRWIKMSSEKPISDEDLSNEFDSYLKSLKWQLIQTRIFKENEITVSHEEVLSHTKGLLIGNYAQYGMPAPEENELHETAMRLLSDKEQANGIYDQLAEKRLTDYFKANMTLSFKQMSYDDFVIEAKK